MVVYVYEFPVIPLLFLVFLFSFFSPFVFGYGRAAVSAWRLGGGIFACTMLSLFWHAFAFAFALFSFLFILVLFKCLRRGW